MKKTTVTQRLANTFPEWSATHHDEQSLGYQILNTLAQNLENMRLQLEQVGKNYFLPTINLDEIDQVHVFELPNTFEFAFATNDPAAAFYQDYLVPTVSGRLGAVWHELDFQDENNIEEFWYKSIPNRIETTVTVSGTDIVLSPTAVNNSPTVSGFSDPHLEGRLHITISGGNKFVDTYKNKVTRGMVQITGTTRKGTTESETLIFLFDDTVTTTKEWSSLDAVRAYNIEPAEATVSIRSSRFNDGPYQDFFNLDHSISSRKVDTFWDLGVTTSGTASLDQVRFAGEGFQTLVLAQLTEKNVVRRTELLDPSGTEVTGALDLALVPFKQRAWVLESDKILLYDTELFYPDMSQMEKKEYNAIANIQVDSYHKMLGDDAEISYVLARPVADVARHRVSLVKPDGTRFSIISGSLVPFVEDSFEFGTSIGRAIREEDIINMDQRGDYIFTFEVQYEDGTASVDQRIVSVESKNALVSINLPFSDAVGIDYDSDQQLWVLDSSNINHRIDLRTDIMLIDFDNKTIFLHEDYDEITVSE